jgi:hypothetical protein
MSIGECRGISVVRIYGNYADSERTKTFMLCKSGGWTPELPEQAMGLGGPGSGSAGRG